MRTLPLLGNLLKLLENVIPSNFIPKITGGHLCSHNDRTLLSLLAMFGGLANSRFHNDGKYEYKNSRISTSSLTELTKDQYQIYSVNETEKIQSNQT